MQAQDTEDLLVDINESQTHLLFVHSFWRLLIQLCLPYSSPRYIVVLIYIVIVSPLTFPLLGLHITNNVFNNEYSDPSLYLSIHAWYCDGKLFPTVI